MRSVQDGRLRSTSPAGGAIDDHGCRAELIEWLGANWLHAPMSALPPITDINGSWLDVRLVPTTDISAF
jgi:hypothetical protein